MGFFSGTKDMNLTINFLSTIHFSLLSCAVSAGHKDTELTSNHPIICHGSTNITGILHNSDRPQFESLGNK